MEKSCLHPRLCATRRTDRNSRASAAAVAARVLADRFVGLPEGISRWRLAAALRVAAPQLRLTPSMLALLAHYIDLTYDADWEAGSEPVIGRPVVEIADALGRSERQIRNLERALMERGLLSWRDSGNQQRRASRGRDGRLCYAYGPTLAPLGTRALELIGLAESCRAELAEARRLRMAIGSLRRRMRSDIASLTGETAAGLGRELDALSQRTQAGTSIEELRSHHAALEALQQRIAETLPDQLHTAPKDTMAEICRRPLPDTMTKHCSSVLAQGRDVTAQDVYRAAGPIVRALCMERNPDWAGLTDAAHQTLPMIGLTQEDWAEACNRMGRRKATTAVILLEHNMTRGVDSPYPAVTRPRAYLRALAGRHEAGRLALDRSIRGQLVRQRADAKSCRTPSWDATEAAPMRYEQRDGQGIMQ